MWIDKGSKCYNRSMKSWLQDNDIEMYSTQNEGKSVVAERFIRTFKNKIYKYTASLSINVYIDKSDEIVINNTYNSTIKIKHIDVNSSTHINFNKQNNKESPRFEVGDHVRISIYKNIFAKGFTPNWSEEVFEIKKVNKKCAMDIC